MTRLNREDRGDVAGFRPWYSRLIVPLILIFSLTAAILVTLAADGEGTSSPPRPAANELPVTLILRSQKPQINSAQNLVVRQTVVVIERGSQERGTGFLLKSNTVVTASHIGGNGTSHDFLVICFGKKTNARRIVADRTRDVAILRTSDCPAEQLRLNATAPDVNEGLVVCGFDFFGQFANEFTSGTSVIPGARVKIPTNVLHTPDGKRIAAVLGSGTELMAITGSLNFGNSGSPVFRQDGSIVGMSLIRDAERGRSFMVSAREIKATLTKNKL